MREMTFLGIRAVKGVVRHTGGPHKVMVGSEMRTSALSVHHIY